MLNRPNLSARQKLTIAEYLFIFIPKLLAVFPAVALIREANTVQLTICCRY